MSQSELTHFFNKLNSMAVEIKVSCLEFYPPSPSMIELISEIFGGKTVPELAFERSSDMPNRQALFIRCKQGVEMYISIQDKTTIVETFP